MTTDAINAKRYRALRAYSQSIRDFAAAHPDHDPHHPKPGVKRPHFGCGVVLCLTGEELDELCDQWVEEA